MPWSGLSHLNSPYDTAYLSTSSSQEHRGGTRQLGEKVSHGIFERTQSNRGGTRDLDNKFLGSADEIAKAQHDDPDIHSLITQMKEGGPRPTTKELQTVSPLTREVWAQYPLLELKDNVLRLKPKDEEKDFKSRGILPECLVKPDLKRSNPK